MSFSALPIARALLPLAVVAVAGGTVLATGGGLGAAFATWIGGAIAVLLAIRKPRPVAHDATTPVPDAPPPSALTLATTDAVLDALPGPVLLTEAGRVVLANAAAVALLGRHVVGQDIRLSIRHPDAAPLLAADGPPPGAEPVLLSGLGSIDQLWELSATPTVIGLTLVHLTDRTAERRADRMRTDFVANASHELRTPLASILGYVETLEGEAGEEAALRTRFLGTVMDEARRMQRLVHDLLSLSRIEADRFRAPTALIDLPTLARQVANEVKAADASAIITVSADPLPAIIGDPAQIAQLIHNLIGNARAYGTPGTPVDVKVAPVDGMVSLSVVDHGEGIAPQHLPRLTERFYRVDAGRSRGAGGTGLGLAIVKHIVERHRGQLSIASTQGVGTTVTAAFPAVTEP